MHFYIDQNAIPICDHAYHLGIVQSSNRKQAKCIEQASERGLNAFFAIQGIGAKSSALNPITGCDLYRKVVIPSVLYGCELWNNLSEKDVSEINKFQHMVSRHIQDLPRLTRTDMHESLIGLIKLSSEVDSRKLSFLGKLISLPNDSRAKEIFLFRLSYDSLIPSKGIGFIPDIWKLLKKYTLSETLVAYMRSNSRPSMFGREGLKLQSATMKLWRGTYVCQRMQIFRDLSCFSGALSNTISQCCLQRSSKPLKI